MVEKKQVARDSDALLSSMVPSVLANARLVIGSLKAHGDLTTPPLVCDSLNLVVPEGGWDKAVCVSVGSEPMLCSLEVILAHLVHSPCQLFALEPPLCQPNFTAVGAAVSGPMVPQQRLSPSMHCGQRPLGPRAVQLRQWESWEHFGFLNHVSTCLCDPPSVDWAIVP